MAFLEAPSAANGGTDLTKFKVIFLGDAGVGKTSLFLRIRDNEFRETIPSSIGVDSCVKTLKVDNKEIQLTIVDTAGAERFRTLTRNFYRNAQAVLLVFSVNEPSTLYYLSKWEQDVREYAPRALKFLIGNKVDQERLVAQEGIESFASIHNCEYAFLSSAKTGQGVQQAIQTISERLLSLYTNTKYDMENSWLTESIHVNQGTHEGRKSGTGGCSC